MTNFKTILITATAALALPSAALAQVPTDVATDAVKEKAIDKVMDNMTTDDAVIAGTTMIKGGSKEDAAVAIIKNRADEKIEAVTGGVSVDEYSKEGVMDAGKEIAQNKVMEKATGSATTYTDGVAAPDVSPADVSAAGGLEAGKAMAMEQARAKAKAMSMEKAKNYGETYGMSDSDKAKRLINAGEPYVIQKSGTATTASAPMTTTMTEPAAVSTLNCPSGTKDAGDGTCMITGDWEP